MLVYSTSVAEDPNVLAKDIPSGVVTTTKEAFPRLPKPIEILGENREKRIRLTLLADRAEI